MKKLFLFLTIVFTSGILFNSLVAQVDENNQRANEFFLRQIKSAHPTPLENLKNDDMLLPLMPQGSGLSNFLNIEVTVNESGTFKMQNESSIAVNPINSANLVGSAVDYRDTSATWVYVSHDAGMSWVNLKLGRPHEGWSASNDPSVAFDLEGNAYLVIGAFGKRSNGLQGQAVENGVYLLRSSDEGKTWTKHISVIEHTGEQTLDSTFEDKYYISVDNSETSPYQGNLYIPWKRVWAKDSATQIVISKSTDKGNTWTQPVAVSPRLPGTSEDTTYGQSFPLAVTGPNGEIYLVWNNGIEHAIGFSRSTDGGNTWTSARLVKYYNIFGKSKEIEPGIWRHVVKGRVRAEAYPSLAVDITNGQRKGWLYLTWAADSVPNIYFSRSTDKGETWSEPVIVHSVTKNDQLWQWIALDRSTGDIAVMYLDSRDDSSNILTAAYVSYSSDGGTTWIDRCAADISSDLRKNPFKDNVFAGDYNGCAFNDGLIYPSWVDMCAAEQNIYDSDVYTAYININKPAQVKNFDAQTIPDKPSEIHLEWDKLSERAFGQPIDVESVKFLLQRDGERIAELDGNTFEYQDISLTKFHLYHYSIRAVADGDTSIAVEDSAWAGGSKEPGVPEFVSSARDNDKLQIKYIIPSNRLDGVTPFVNPSEFKLYRSGVPINSYEIGIEDVGGTLEVKDTVPGNGFYVYTAKVSDSFGNESPASEEVNIYAGDRLNNYSDDFNESQLRKYLNEDSWGLSASFARNGQSLTDSPGQDYAPLNDKIITIFPYEGVGDSVIFSFWQAAFVENGDSAIVEYSQDSMKTWSKLDYFDKSKYAPWGDGVKDDNDWLYASYSIKNISSSVYFRFRLKTNAIRQNDGWYIDDLAFGKATGVYQQSDADKIVIYPNPASGFINIDLSSLREIKVRDIAVFDYLGQKLNLSNTIRDNYYHINTSKLKTGVYFIKIRLNTGKFIVKKFIKMAD